MLIFTGVGPGDPELITLKAVEELRGADAITLADSGGESAAERIAGRYFAGKPIIRLSMPMRGGKNEWRAAHEAAAEALLAELAKGLTIAYPVLGDPSLYATSSYLLKLIAPVHPCRVIPGVPAMCAVAAALCRPLAESRESLTVLPGLSADAPLPEGNVVIMKAAGDLETIRAKAGGREAYVARNLGMPGEALAPLSDYTGDSPSYFTTVIIH